MRYSLQRLLQAFYTRPFEKPITSSLLLHKDLESEVALQVVRHLKSNQKLSVDTYYEYLYGFALRGDVPMVQAGIANGKKTGIVNDLEYQDILAQLALTNRNLPEMCLRIKNIVENYPGKFGPTKRLAHSFVSMGYTGKELEDTWAKVNKEGREYKFITVLLFIINDLVQNPSKLYSQELQVPEGEEGALEKNKEDEETIESLKTQNLKLQKEVNILRNRLYGVYFKGEAQDNKGKVLEWVQEVRKGKLVPDARAAEELMAGLDKTDELGLKVFFKELSKFNHIITPKNFLDIFQDTRVELAAKERWLTYMQNMRNSKLKPGTVFWIHMIDSAAEEGNNDKVAEYVSKLEADATLPITGYNTIFARYSIRGAGKTEDILQWVDKMKKTKTEPNGDTYRFLMDHAANAGDEKLVERWLREAKLQNTKFPFTSFSTWLDKFARKGNIEAVEVLAEEAKGGYEIAKIVDAILVGLAASEKKQESRKWMEIRRANSNSAISGHVYNEIFQEVLKKNNKGEAVFWLTEMRKDGMTPSEDVIVRLRQLVGKKEEPKNAEVKKEEA